jgi:hypothetical protein
MRQPWKAIGMSRAGWYRHGKPTTKPKRYTQADIAKIAGVSLRTIQRDLASERQKLLAGIRELMAQGHGFEETLAMAKARGSTAVTAVTDDPFIRRRIEMFERGTL